MQTQTDQTNTEILYRRSGNDAHSERPRLLAQALRDAGVNARYVRVTRDDHDGDWDDWTPGEYCFVAHPVAAAWAAAEPSAPRTNADEHYAFMVAAVAAANCRLNLAEKTGAARP